MKRKPNFTGYATKYGVLCSDGRTIVANAFEHQDGIKLPLVYRHGDKDNPKNVLGHVILEHEKNVGVKAHAYFNNSENGIHARISVEHEDLDSLSIRAVNLKQKGAQVIDGQLTEVSLVPHGANKEARIESVFIQHEDGIVEEMEHEAIIYMGLTLEHADEDSDDDSDHANEDEDGETIQDVYDTLNDKQKALVEALVNRAEEMAHEEGSGQMANVFDQTDKDKKTENVLTHEQVHNIIDYAVTKKVTLKDAILEHADPYGITNIEELFPEPKDVQDRPEWIKRDDTWVQPFLSAVHRSPFSRIRSRSADVTHQEARAKGYIKGNRKKDEYFSVAKRDTTPTTVYKKQKLDRDDIIDITSFDVVSYMKEEMRWMLSEELARAILFGDNREPDDEDKIDTTKIRPVAFDDEFYTAKVMVNANMATKTLMAKVLRSRKLLKGGSGKPNFYTTDDLIIDMLLLEDQLGRRYYETEAALAAALGVREIVDAEVLEDGYEDEDGNQLIGVLVNPRDITVGADRGGQVTMFDDFDLDFNQFKYLIETRISSALTKHRSAVALFTTDAVRILPDEPEMTGLNTVEVPTQTGVEYVRRVVGEPDEDISGSTVTITEANSPYTIVAQPADGYRFPMNVTTSWTFTWTDPEDETP